jgi:hypothetical protein
LLFFDDTEHPVVRITIVGIPTPDDDTAYMERIDALLDAGDPFALVIDDRSMGEGDIRRWSRRLLRWAVARRAQLRHACVGMAVVVDELALLRDGRGPRTVQPLVPVPVSVFTAVDMAQAWLCSRLAPVAGRVVAEQYAR